MTQPIPSRLPLIPISPLIHTSSEYGKLMAHITKSLSEDNSPETKSNLERSLVKEREKLDRLTKNMEIIQKSLLNSFSVYDVAKEIAYINSSLFRMITLNENWLCNFDKQSNIIPLLDFHRYLSHSFAHQAIMNCDLIKDKRKPASIIGELIQIAYILLYTYRDFSGCTAILSCLQMPEVQRLESIWSICPSKLINIYKELVLLLSSHNNYGHYHQQLRLHMAEFLSITPTKSQMIAVPFMQAHLNTIQSLINTHSSSSVVTNTNKRVNIVLSNTGQEILTSIVHILEFCQQHTKIDMVEFERFTKQSNAPRKRLSFRNSTIKLSVSPCLDLDQIKSNPNIYHWLVSRVYLNTHQLHDESLNIEPLVIGEIDLEPEEEYDMFWEFFSQDYEIKKEPPTKPKRQLKSDDMTVDDLMIVHPALDNIPPETISFSSTSNHIANETELDSSLQIEIPPLEEEQEMINSEPSEPIIQQDVASKLEAIEVIKDHPSSTSSSINPLLSPTVSESVPQKLNEDSVAVLTEEEEEEEEWTGYPVNSSPSQIATDEDIQEGEEEEEEEEEEWTGYPIKDDEEDEEDEEEVWKGYPMPQEDEEQDRISPAEPSTPTQETSTQEEWKGYHDNEYWNNNGRKNQLHAIGKAAARRMQYSISNTDTSRKRLPSPFAPSSST